MNASVFHSSGWLRALHKTYGMEPLALTTSTSHEELSNAVLLCVVRSWITGTRLVSVPFSDHCELLVDNHGDLGALLNSLESLRVREGARYIELRPKGGEMEFFGSFRPGLSFCHHVLDLQPALDVLYHRFHKACVQRKIRRAEREGLTYEAGRSLSFVEAFYRLFKLTRTRRQIPPQPIEWFQNVVECLGDNVRIGIVRKNDVPVAGMITLIYGKTLVYKYGGSDAEYHKFGGMQMLLWQTIREAKIAGLDQLDFGRSGWDDDGLITFKDRWGAQRSALQYWRSPGKKGIFLADEGWHHRYARKIFSSISLPDNMLRLIGKLLYRHLS